MYKSASFATCHSKLTRARARSLAFVCVTEKPMYRMQRIRKHVALSLISMLFQISAIQLPFDCTLDNKSDCGEIEKSVEITEKSVCQFGAYN